MVAADDPRAGCLVDVLCGSLGPERRAELQSKLLSDSSGAVAAFIVSDLESTHAPFANC